MTMISAQSICMCSPCSPCSPCLPQLRTCIRSPVSLSFVRERACSPQWSSGFFRNGRGRGTLTTRQASPLFPFFSGPEDDASHADEVPALAKGTRVLDFTGTKTVELVDPILPAKFVDDQLPSLFTLVIDGYPPFKISKYVDEAENRMHQYVAHYRNVIALDSYCRAGLSAAAYGHPEVINVDRLVAIAINYALQFLLDDLFFDTPSEFLEDQYGICHGARESPQSMQECLDHLDAVFSLQVEPSNPASVIETIMWDAGQYTLGLTNPEWFHHYVAAIKEHHLAGVASHADIVQGHNSYFQDVDSYALMRAGNVGGKFIQMMVELASDSYIPNILRTDPYMEKVTTTASIHLGLVNDIFSYHKESLLEQNPRNLISVLLECEGKPFVQTVHMAIDLVNSYAHAIMDLDAKAWSSTLQNYMQGIKELTAGNAYFCLMDNRYRHVDAYFPELRGMTSNWRIPDDKRPKL